MNIIYLGTILFLAGMYASLMLFDVAAYAYYFLFTSMLFLVFGIVFKKFKSFIPYCVGIIFLFLGLWAGSSVLENPKLQLEQYENQQIEFYGKIEPLSLKKNNYGTSFIVNCEAVKINGISVGYQQKLRVFAIDKKIPEVGYVYGSGELMLLNGFRNPGSFDSDRWNYVNGVGGGVKKAQVKLVNTDKSILDYAALLNIALREKINSLASGKAGAVLSGMLLGGSSGLDDEVKDVFASNGLSHLLSVSGTHLVLLAGFLSFLLNPLPRRLRVFAIIAILFAYAAVCGFKPPVLRALCMSIVLLFGGSGAQKGNILCLTAVIMLIFKPLWMFDIGFQLSFGAAAGLIWLLPKLKTYLCECLPEFIGEMCAVTLAAQLAVVPFLVAYFHQLSLISLISNVVLVPVLEIAGLLTLLGVLTEAVFTSGGYPVTAAAFFTEQILVQSQALAAIPYSTLVIGTLPIWCGVAYYFTLAVAADLPCVQFLQNRERRYFIAIMSTLLFVCILWQKIAPQKLTAYFLDVGQGDCAVIVTPSKDVIVIDTGGLKNYDTGAKILTPFLYSIGKTKIDALLLSHGDYDHAGGGAGLARKIEIDKIILPQEAYTAAEKNLLKYAAGSKTETAVTGRIYTFGDAELQIIDAPQGSSGNKASVVAAVKHKNGSMLFTGDIDAKRELNLSIQEHYDVLKAAHHGSKYSSSEEFLQQVRPLAAVISVGRGNAYNHPHKETLERLQAVNAKILRTDTMGAIKLIFDDDGTKCYSYVYHKNYF